MAEVNIQSHNLYGLKDANIRQKLSLVVTADGSRYEDDVWSYGSEIEQRNIKKSLTVIKWDIDLLNGHNLTEYKYATLLETVKDFIFSLRVRQSKSVRTLKATSIIKIHKCLIPLLRWMASQEILAFSSLTVEAVTKYLTHLRTLDSRYGSPISEGEIFKRLQVIDLLWIQAEFVSNGLVVNPFPNDSPYVLSGITKAKQQEKKFDFIPDGIAMSLANIAVNYVRNKAKNILAADDAVNLAYESAVRKKSLSVADRRAREVAKRFGYKYVKDVSTDVGYLRTACYIVIALFSGIRDSEMSSLDINCLEDDIEGGYLWIRGHIYKTADQKIKARWMVPPVVKEAVKVAENLTVRLRLELMSNIKKLDGQIKAPLITGHKRRLLEKEISELRQLQKALWLVKSSKLGNSISSNKTIHQQLLVFMNNHDVSLNDGKVWKLHPHQFRRTFVRFMVKNAMNIKYLQEHFRHVSLDMTAWYDIEDVGLTKEIVDCYTEMSNKALVEIVNSNYIAGKGGEMILEKRDTLFQGVISQSREHIIKAMADTVTLRSTGVSWCLGDIENGECSGVHGCMIDPSNVNKCSQAIVTSEFLPAWREIKLRNQELLERDDLGLSQKQAISNFLESVVKPVMNGLSDQGK